MYVPSLVLAGLPVLTTVLRLLIAVDGSVDGDLSLAGAGLVDGSVALAAALDGSGSVDGSLSADGDGSVAGLGMVLNMGL